MARKNSIFGCDDMNSTNKFLKAFAQDLDSGFDPAGMSFPKSLVERMLANSEYFARQSGQEHEREDNVCRMLASGMPIEEISLILKIRTDEIRIIERNNTRVKIPEYTRTYKSRAKSRARAAKQISPLPRSAE